MNQRSDPIKAILLARKDTNLQEDSDILNETKRTSLFKAFYRAKKGIRHAYYERITRISLKKGRALI